MAGLKVLHKSLLEKVQTAKVKVEDIKEDVKLAESAMNRAKREADAEEKEIEDEKARRAQAARLEEEKARLEQEAKAAEEAEAAKQADAEKHTGEEQAAEQKEAPEAEEQAEAPNQTEEEKQAEAANRAEAVEAACRVGCAMKVADLQQLNDEVQSDVVTYGASHRFHRKELKHVCINDPCPCSSDHRGVTVLKFADVLSSELRAITANMHYVVARFVKPRTKGLGMCFAHLLHPEGLAARVFISHTWSGCFDEMVRILSYALHPEDTVWICSFAIDQWADVQGALNQDLTQSPFARALADAQVHLIVVDEGFDVLKRVWCVYEVWFSLRRGNQLHFWFDPDRNFEAGSQQREIFLEDVRQLDCEKAQASFQQDADRIKNEIIAEDESFDPLNRIVRTGIADRILFFNAAVENVKGRIKVLETELSHLHLKKGTCNARIQELEQHLQDAKSTEQEVAKLTKRLENMQQKQFQHEEKISEFELELKFIIRNATHKASLQASMKELQRRLNEEGVPEDSPMRGLSKLVQTLAIENESLEALHEEKNQKINMLEEELAKREAETGEKVFHFPDCIPRVMR
eukprot:gnl/TRDRNA2_/TRDRNA2_163474_c0_seq2.p1 gnl/TRDRNA2_/TRDRNA2_163474_c0~~gnl/TRDRNA2_/TRDRNA2_163474_c0_seq2.p1  ORF type:complete len:577 (+),score=121.47 gnl/TRDRNA2_/TRDRNA2_163474_c0_seq2:188-1918(+)